MGVPPQCTALTVARSERCAVPPRIQPALAVDGLFAIGRVEGKGYRARRRFSPRPNDLVAGIANLHGHSER
ncbi:hypothetical protein EVAR_11587_1 [Eumeta japonica]|uniref:Uncharacterized protein n=1 Tax=Eumeta variegata TaxID=151549 RepID=A0A4C1X7R1_EUMVA|nr:hypothetical protein EVAR_11587_1 [Eumeta japonica]